MGAEGRRGEVLSRRTTQEHDAMVQAVHVLERALVSAAPGRESAWKRRAGAALAVVEDLVRQHVESAEGEGGLFQEIELTLGRPRNLTLAKNEHERLLKASRALLLELDEKRDDPAFPAEEVRERTLRLTLVLRRHAAREADLVYSAFDLDLGAGD